MYNRYIPQPDGTFRRNRVPDRSNPPRHRPQPPKEAHCENEEQRVHESPAPHPPAPSCPDNCPHRRQDQGLLGGSVGSFLKQLLPKDFDTSDLLIVLLLLLMGGDCAEDQNTALLTLAIYLFL